MNSFPENITFKYPWRTYQARVLKDLQTHLDDNHLNIVAAPGSGKTVLGLEVMLRLNQPTIILAPTIAIRNQWLLRFRELFLQTNKLPDWISDDIRKPGFVTVSTYQGLYAAFSVKEEPEEEIEEDGEITEAEFLEDEQEEDAELNNPQTIDLSYQSQSADAFADQIEKQTAEQKEKKGEEEREREREKQTKKVIGVLDRIQAVGVKTLVVDEAHHLRNEWWKHLTFLKEQLDRPTIVALTATPPYDVSPFEWKRYQQLCGPIDEEVSVPELVLKENLCPHQDFVYLNGLSREEGKAVAKFRASVKKHLKKIKKDADFVAALSTHPYLLDPESYIPDILKHAAYTSSMLIFLHEAKVSIPKQVLKILGVKKRDIPKMNLGWFEILLTNFLFKDELVEKQDETLIKRIKKDLRQVGVVERRAVILENTSLVKKLLKASVNKMESIRKILQIEHELLEDNLRMVVLTDFIRKEFLPKKKGDEKPLTRLGVVSIFESLRRDKTVKASIGVLSGSIVIIPALAADALFAAAKKLHIPNSHIRTTSLKADSRFVRVKIRGESNQNIVHLITELFSAGNIQVLVGTKSLLGEGWDAPSINTLVLASFVGSFMLSNQMRGRAIRTLKTDPNKTANIWHLVSIETESSRAGYDFGTLKRRFQSFVGLSTTDSVIESGLARLNLGKPPYTQKDIERMNHDTHALALGRRRLKGKWMHALNYGEVGKVVPEIQTEAEQLPRSSVFVNMIYALVMATITTLGIFLQPALEVAFRSYQTLNELMTILSVIFLVASLYAIPRFLKALYLFFKHGPIHSSLRQIGIVVLKTLHKMELIKTDAKKIRVRAEKTKTGSIVCSLYGGTAYEKALFLDVLQQVLDPIDSPRYLIKRKSLFGIVKRKDFHAVPDLIGAKKKWAIYFARLWKKYVGPTEVIYTRTIEGRKLLLKARKGALSSAFQFRSERISSWK